MVAAWSAAAGCAVLCCRLTQQLHKMYTSNRAYYAASTLGGLTHADQRITEDVEKFCFSISDLYSHTFKVGQSLLCGSLLWGSIVCGGRSCVHMCKYMECTRTESAAFV